MSKLTIKVKPGGKVETTVTGAPGGTCRVVSKPYSEAFAGRSVSDKPTAEADMPEITETNVETEKEQS